MQQLSLTASISLTKGRQEKERQKSKRKNQRKVKDREIENDVSYLINQSYQSILIHLTIDVPPQEGKDHE